MHERGVGRDGAEAGRLVTVALRGVSRLRRMVVNLGHGFVYGAAVLGEPITVAGAVAGVEARLRTRAEVFLDVVERAIFGMPDSPYRPLLAASGYDLARVQALVRQRGVEAALQQLCRDGVYVSIEEFKGLRPAHRGAYVFRFQEGDFHNPISQSAFRVSSGGTRGRGTDTVVPAAGLRVTAEHWALGFAANGLELLPVAMWFPQRERSSLMVVMMLAAGRHVPKRWFTQLPGWRLALVDDTHAFYVGINLAAQKARTRVPSAHLRGPRPRGAGPAMGRGPSPVGRVYCGDHPQRGAAACPGG